MSDFYTKIREFAESLSAIGLSEWTLRLTNAIKAGSTGGEILMALRWNLQELLQNEPLLTGSLKQQAEDFIKEITATGV
ncbi:MAG TPA: hypothetical protein VGY56_02390 [Verrucomicrobiae bacterium]|nr:hypothetical protein [Verrucomicrobiae bacterium]